MCVKLYINGKTSPYSSTLNHTFLDLWEYTFTYFLSLTHFLWTKAHPRSLYHPLELCISSKSSMEVFWYISKYMVTSLHHFAVFRRDLCLLPAVGLYLTHAVNPLEQAFAIGPCLFKPFICLSPLPFTLSEDSGCILISAVSIHAKYTCYALTALKHYRRWDTEHTELAPDLLNRAN